MTVAPFKNPNLDAPTPLTVDGTTLYGHVADWGAEHIGRRGVHAPRNHSGYRYFHLGAYDYDGVEVDVGPVTLHTLHAEIRLPADEARRQYEDTGSVAAYVRVGEDEHGIWCCGRIAQGLSAADVEALRASKLSGDWRPIKGHAELIGILACNIPGFQIPRAHALLAAGAPEPLALVACGIVMGAEPDARQRLRARVARKRLARRIAR